MKFIPIIISVCMCQTTKNLIFKMEKKIKLIFLSISISLVVFVFVIILGYYNLVIEQGCPIGEYLCQNTTKCINKRLSCNKEVDCPYRDDEEYCYNVDLIDNLKEMMLKNRKPSHVNASHVNVSHCYVSNFPENCTCEMDTLYCDNITSLDIIPQNVDGPLKILKFFNNNMKILNDNSFVKYTNLTVVSIKSMLITEVRPGAFRGLENLNSLYFTETNLKIIKSGFFEGLNSLTNLQLEHNQIIDFDMQQLENITYLFHLHLSNNKLTLKGCQFPPLLNLTYITLSNNLISTIEQDLFSNLLNLDSLNLNDNLIELIHPNAFLSLTNLKYLKLHNNKLRHLDNSVFDSQIYLNDLSLSENPLINFNQKLISNLTRMSKLRLEGLTIYNISGKMFQHMTKLNEVFFKEFQYCRYVPRIRNCHPHTDGISSNENLLASISQRICVWIMIMLSDIGNLMVIFYRLPLLKKNVETQTKSEHFFLINLATADFLMTIYLAIIAVHDEMFRGEYFRHSNSFLASPICMTAGIVGTVSSEVSILTLTAMTIERWSSLVDLSKPPKGLKVMMKFFLSIWTGAVIIAVVPIFIWSERNQFYGSNGVCFPLNTDQVTSGWQYSAFMMTLNMLCIGVIATCYTKMIVLVKGSNGPLRHNLPRMSIKIFAIVMTDCCCWIPIILSVFIGISGNEIPLAVKSWIIVFILPINSALNPIIYTINTRIYISSFKKLKHRMITSIFKFRAKNNLFAVELSDRPNQSDISDRQHVKSTGIDEEYVTQNIRLSTISPASDSHLEIP